MKSLTHLAAVSSLALALSACVSAPVSGFLWTDVKGGVTATEAYGGSARGEACASSILGAVATGDASIDTAKKVGGIAQVVTIDYSVTNILGIYAKYCTIVYGKRGATPAAKPAPATAAPAAGSEG